MSYYRLIRSIDELVGEIGLLRLPKYIFDVYVFDESRSLALRHSLDSLSRGDNVLITGYAGVGKTALMAIIIKNLLERGYKIGHILEGVTSIGNDHVERGVVVFYDDIPRMNKNALRSIIFNRVTGILATARIEEFDQLRKKLGVAVEDVFRVYEIHKLSDKRLTEILNKYAQAEGIIIDEEAIPLVIRKAENLPVYIWQVIRDLKIKGLTTLTAEIAKRIPKGMLNYVEDILWSILDMHPERHAVLLALLIISDLPKYEVNIDLFYAIFCEALSIIRNEKISIPQAILNELFGKILRYIVKIDPYTYKLPHDSWGDVLKGYGAGLMSGEISTINTLFPYDDRLAIIDTAIDRVYKEIMPKVDDELRINAFENYVAKIKITMHIEKLRIVKKEEKIGGEYIKVMIVRDSSLPRSAKSAKKSPLCSAIANNPVAWSVWNMSRTQILKNIEIETKMNTSRIIYPQNEKLRVKHILTRKYVSIINLKNLMALFAIVVLLILLTIYAGAIFGVLIPFLLILWIGASFEYIRILLEVLYVYGDKEITEDFVSYIKSYFKKNKIPPIHLERNKWKVLRKLNIHPNEIARMWE